MNSQFMRRIWQKAMLAAVFCVVSPLVVVCLRSQAQETNPAPAVPAGAKNGVAVVLNRKMAPTTELPSLEKLEAAPDALPRQMRAKGLSVFANEDGRCLAITRVRIPTEDEVIRGGFSNAVLSALLVKTVTREQLAKRDRGYLKTDVLTPLQRLIVKQVALREKMIDKNGKPTQVGMHLMVGLYPKQVTQKLHWKNGKVAWDQVDVHIYPPTEAAVPAHRLRDSLLWRSWPYVEASWGEEAVSLAAGAYTLRDLTAKVAALTSWKIKVDQRIPNIPLAVIARDVSLRKLLWTVSVATGSRVRVFATSKTALLSAPGAEDGQGGQDGAEPFLEFQIPGAGYLSPMANEDVAEMLNQSEDFKAAKGEKTLAWRFSDLPLLHRQLLTFNPKEGPGAKTPTEELKSATVFWIQGVEVSIGLFTDQLGGGGPEYFIPAL